MEQTVSRNTTVVRCEVTRATLFRSDPDGRGVWIWCRGHHAEELKTWKELGLTRKIVDKLEL